MTVVPTRPTSAALRPALTLAGASALALAAALAHPATAAAEPTRITILHINDLDRMEELDGKGGFARLVGAVRQEEARAEHTILTHGGDAISPSLMTGFDQGAHIIDLMNAAGIDIFVPGNHEYDLGPDVAKARFAEATFPIVATNNIDADGKIVAGTVPTVMMDVAGYKFGFLGLTTTETTELASPGAVTFADPETTAAETAAALRDQGADFVIALAHIPFEEDMRLLRDGDVDLILGGHDEVLASYYNGKTGYVESESQANYVTAVDLTLDRVEQSDGTSRLVWWPAFRTIDTSTVQPDAAMAAKVQTYLDRLSSELDVEIGTTETALDSRRATVRSQESAIGNLIADAMRAAVGADVAITNGGGIRADRTYDAGTVLTRRDIQSELPFGNLTVKLEVTGQAIMDALENGVSQVEAAAGRFPQVSGLAFTYDPTQPAGGRVTEVTVGGQPIDLGRTYTLATNDYMAGGGDGYTAFAGARTLIDAAGAQIMASQVIDYIDRAGTVAPSVEGRIKTLE